MRGHVKALFDSYSLNPRAAGGSAVEPQAFVEMMAKHGESLNCINFDPATDMPELDEHGRVTFKKFELCASRFSAPFFCCVRRLLMSCGCCTVPTGAQMVEEEKRRAHAGHRCLTRIPADATGRGELLREEARGEDVD